MVTSITTILMSYSRKGKSKIEYFKRARRERRKKNMNRLSVFGWFLLVNLFIFGKINVYM